MGWYIYQLLCKCIPCARKVEAGEEVGVQWWIVEQDESRLTPFESLEISINYLKNRLQQLNN